VEAKMKLDDCRERRVRTANCMMAGRGRRVRGIGGKPKERLERERKTNVWSRGGHERVSRLGLDVVGLTAKGPEGVVIPGRVEEVGPDASGGQGEDEGWSDALALHQLGLVERGDDLQS